jgi:hypothetical protein
MTRVDFTAAPYPFRFEPRLLTHNPVEEFVRSRGPLTPSGISCNQEIPNRPKPRKNFDFRKEIGIRCGMNTDSIEAVEIGVRSVGAALHQECGLVTRTTQLGQKFVGEVHRVPIRDAKSPHGRACHALKFCLPKSHDRNRRLEETCKTHVNTCDCRFQNRRKPASAIDRW